MSNRRCHEASEWAIEYVKKIALLFEMKGDPYDEDLLLYLALFVDEWSLEGFKISDSAVELLLDWAYSGNRGSYDLAVFICTIELRAGNLLSSRLAEFVVMCLEGKIHRPPFRGGKSRDCNVLRDYTVLDMLDFIETNFVEIARSRNDATDTISAHDIVADAFQESLVQITRKDVKNIDENNELKLRWRQTKDFQEMPSTERAELIESLLARVRA